MSEKRLLFENKKYKISESESLSYIKNKESLEVVESELDNKELVSNYLDIIEDGEDNEFFDNTFRDFVVESIASRSSELDEEVELPIKSCEYCAKDSHDRKNIVDVEDQVVEVVYIEGESFLDVDKAVDMGTHAGVYWEISRVPIDYCPKCGTYINKRK